MSVLREIPPRDGVRVYPVQGGLVGIKQIDQLGDESIVVVHPDDVPQLIQFLEEVRQEILAYDDNDEDS